MTATRGKKDPSLLVKTGTPVEPGMTYVALRPILVGELVVPAGVEVPPDQLGPRPEAWVRSRRLRVATPNEKFTSFADYATMVETAIAEAEALLEAHRPPPEDTSTEE